jgi:antitoxin VapB
MAKAKIFHTGGSQAVRLPKEFRFPEGEREVTIRRVGRRLILELTDEWSPEFLATLGAWNQEIERPAQTPITELKNPFD